LRANYLKGRDREYYVVNRLRNEGALIAKRSYGSKGPIDVLAVFPDCVRLIQVKKNGIRREELIALKKFASRITSKSIKVELWIYRGKGRGVEIKELNRRS
jgi:Holliday junction resolvase